MINDIWCELWPPPARTEGAEGAAQTGWCVLQMIDSWRPCFLRRRVGLGGGPDTLAARSWALASALAWQGFPLAPLPEMNLSIVPRTLCLRSTSLWSLGQPLLTCHPQPMRSISKALDGLVPCHGSDLISYHPPSYSSFFSSHTGLCAVSPHIIYVACSLTSGLLNFHPIRQFCNDLPM